jgi:hypothetical protein
VVIDYNTLSSITPSQISSPNMDTLVARLQPQSRVPEDVDGDDYTGYGNLDKNGMITGMALPRVADVRACPARLEIYR